MYTIYSNNLEKMWIIKSLLSWILSLVVAAVIFCVAIILIPMQTHTIETIELTYVFVDWDQEYDIFYEWHGAADDWSFLFDDSVNEKINEDNNWNTQENTEYLPNKDYIWNPIEKDDIILDDENLEELLWDEIVDNIDNKDVRIIEKEIIAYESCVTPWNNTINHGESVLAYEQRADVPTICNVQRRTCEDGILKWNFEQASCREDIKYEYTKVKVISFNNKKPGELIQNPWYAKNDSSEFDTDGKINNTNHSANFSWNNNDNRPVSNNGSTDLTHKDYYNCMSPWWDVVWHGQFIKSYESPLWFVDDKCKVELRLCLDGNLKWHHSFKTCEHKDVTYQDYRAWNDDITKPTPELMVETLVEDGGWLFNRFWNLFN